MLGLDALATMKVAICTPAYGFAVTPQYSVSVFRAASEFPKAGCDIFVDTLSDAMVTRARNRLVARFLQNSDAFGLTHLFFVDADIGFSPEQMARILLADKDVCAGVYPLKEYKWPDNGAPIMTTGLADFTARFVDYPFNTAGTKLVSDEHGYAEVAEAPTGFMCIKRSVIDKMRAAYPELRYRQDHVAWDDDDDRHYAFFEGMIEPMSRRYLSEDYTFCKRWRDMGGKVFIDLHSKLSHQGPHTWHGDLLAHLQLSEMRVKPKVA